MIIGEELRDFQVSQPDKPAIITDEMTVSYEEFVRNIGSIQHFLLTDFGEDPTIRIALKLGNETAFLEVFFASVMLGYRCIPLDPKWTEGDLNSVLEESQPNLVVTHKVYEKMLGIRSVPILTKATPLHIFYIGFTSGSTGVPKGFMRHHLSWTDSFKGCSKAFRLDRNDVYCAPGPLCHSLSLFAAVYALHIGATLVLPRKFDAEHIQRFLNDHHVTTMFVVPTMLQALVGTSRNSEQFLSVTSILSSGAKWDSLMKDSVKNVFPNAKRAEFYGASETSFITYLDETGFTENPNSVGIPFPGVEVSIRDKTGQDLPPNKIGEVFLKSTMIFSGYLHEPQDQPKLEITVDDLGFMDESGYLTLVGRKKNMIISGGLNIYPEEIESYLKKVDGIEEVIVTGVSDSYWGEKVVALIKWKKATEKNESFLVKYCKRGLSAYKCPKKFYTIDNIVFTSSGKVARNQVLNMYPELVGSDKS